MKKIQFYFFLSKLGMLAPVLYPGKNPDVMISAGTDQKGGEGVKKEKRPAYQEHTYTIEQVPPKL